jgi:hypothetical protein
MNNLMAERYKPVENSSRKEKISEVKPFIIRGHHFEHFINVARGISPEEQAQGTVEVTQNDRNEAILILKNSTNKKEREKAEIHKRYVYDVLGSTRKDSENFEKSLKKVLEDFTKLPDNHPVKLVAEQKDNICKKCPFVGNHCDLSDNNDYVTDEIGATATDTAYVNVFKYLTKKNNIKITAFEELSPFSDGESIKTESILTTAGIVKKVFNDRDFRRILKLKEE